MLWRIAALLLVAALLLLPGASLRADPSGMLPQTLPSGAIDRPSPDASAHGVVRLEGWAIDPRVAQGSRSGVERVAVYLDGAHVTDAQLGFERPDIAAAFGQRFAASGWQAVLDLESLVAPGPHELEVRILGSDASAPVVLRRALHVDGPPRFCVNTHLLWFDPVAAARDLERARLNGLTSVRFDVNWDRLEPHTRGAFDPRYVATLDVVLDMAAARGLHPVLAFVGTPAWARSEVGDTLTPPSDPNDFGSALGRLAAHLAHRRGIAYEIWNEPNQVAFWSAPDGPDAAVYTAMLKAAYSQIKAAAPAATVLGGSIAFNDRAYLEAMFAAGAAGHFDALALHPYNLDQPPESTTDRAHSYRLAINDALAMLDAHGATQTPVWITEVGWSSRNVPDATRAEYFTRAIELAHAQPRVALFCAYELNQADDARGQEAGLVAADGTPTRSWLAYGEAARARQR